MDCSYTKPPGGGLSLQTEAQAVGVVRCEVRPSFELGEGLTKHDALAQSIYFLSYLLSGLSVQTRRILACDVAEGSSSYAMQCMRLI